MPKLSSKEIEAALKGLWTVQTICEKSAVVPQTVFNWITAGMPCVRIGGDHRDTLRFVPDEVKEWAKSNGKAIR